MFRIIKKSKISQARLGVLKTAHGEIKTPFFMPVATQGAVKHITTQEMKKLEAQILLANTYHLMLRPGAESIKKFGGLHKFMDWSGPILTDSGGFQVFSLSGKKRKAGENLVKIKDQGVEFISYIDGSRHYLTPEKSLKIQSDLGVDIAVCLDECPALPAEKEALERAVLLTLKWAVKTKKYHAKLKGEKPLLFCVIQGGLDKNLRLKNLRGLIEIGESGKKIKSDWDGYNIGGLSVGESAQEMYGVLDYLCPAMPENKPRYLMGVGYPENIIEAVKRGVDMFDCVIPTREGRHGRLFFWTEGPKKQPSINFGLKKTYLKANINKSAFAKDKSPINCKSKLPELRNLSKSYLHYLFKIKEPLGQRLASLNNLEFYFSIMEHIRKNIKNNLL